MRKPTEMITKLFAREKVRNAEFWTALKSNTRFRCILGASIAFVSASTVVSVRLFRDLMPYHSPLLPTLLGTLVAGIIAILVLYGVVYPQLGKLRRGKNG